MHTPKHDNDIDTNHADTEREEGTMLSHQPEVSRLLHQEYVARLADDAQRHEAQRAQSQPRHARQVRPARAALDVSHRRLPSQS